MTQFAKLMVVGDVRTNKSADAELALSLAEIGYTQRETHFTRHATPDEIDAELEQRQKYLDAVTIATSTRNSDVAKLELEVLRSVWTYDGSTLIRPEFVMLTGRRVISLFVESMISRLSSVRKCSELTITGNYIGNKQYASADCVINVDILTLDRSDCRVNVDHTYGKSLGRIDDKNVDVAERLLSVRVWPSIPSRSTIRSAFATLDYGAQICQRMLKACDVLNEIGSNVIDLVRQFERNNEIKAENKKNAKKDGYVPKPILPAINPAKFADKDILALINRAHPETYAELILKDPTIKTVSPQDLRLALLTEAPKVAETSVKDMLKALEGCTGNAETVAMLKSCFESMIAGKGVEYIQEIPRINPIQAERDKLRCDCMELTDRNVSLDIACDTLKDRVSQLESQVESLETDIRDLITPRELSNVNG